jgi:hypothetical protein
LAGWLTGMSTALQQLAAALAPAQAARAQQRYSQQRGGRIRRATGNPRSRPLFDDVARLLLTLGYQRQVCSMNVLADLLEVTATCIGDLVKQTHEILEDHGHDPGVAPVRFATADALLSFLGSDLRPARTAIIERLSHPALTGLTQHQLHELTSRLAMRQSAQAERLSYQRRGGPRQPGTRGGVFHQKISNSERVLLALLYHRRLCTLDVLAGALGDVSRSAVGNVIRETLPPAPARRPHSRARANPISHSRRSPRRRSSEQHGDKLILYGFTGHGTSLPRSRPGCRPRSRRPTWKVFDTEDLTTAPGPTRGYAARRPACRIAPGWSHRP